MLVQHHRQWAKIIPTFVRLGENLNKLTRQDKGIMYYLQCARLLTTMMAAITPIL